MLLSLLALAVRITDQSIISCLLLNSNSNHTHSLTHSRVIVSDIVSVGMQLCVVLLGCMFLGFRSTNVCKFCENYAHKDTNEYMFVSYKEGLWLHLLYIV